MAVGLKSTPNIHVVDNTAFLVIEKSIYNTKEGIRRGLLDVAPEIEREVVRMIKEPPKTGRLYSFGGRIHQASAPGEAPADLTGQLAESVGSEVTSPTQLVIGDDISAPHGEWMEFGTDDGRIAPRPHLKPAALSKAREVGQSLNRGVKRELGKVHK